MDTVFSRLEPENKGGYYQPESTKTKKNKNKGAFLLLPQAEPLVCLDDSCGPGLVRDGS